MSSLSDRTGVAVLMLIACTVFWGSNVVVGRAVHADLPPVGLAFWRNIVALAVLLPFTWRTLIAQGPGIRRHVVLLAGAGLVGTALFNALIYAAVHTTIAINAALMISLSPVAIPVIAYFMLRERLSTRQTVGIAVSLVGVLVIISRGDLALLKSLSVQPGDLLMFGAMLCWSYYSVIVKRKPTELGPYTFLAAILVFANLALLPFYLWESAVGMPMPLTQASVLAIVYLGVFPTALALLLFNRAVLVLGANRTGLFNHLVPVFATLLAIIFLHERPALYHAAGAAFIVFGLYLSTVRAASR